MLFVAPRLDDDILLLFKNSQYLFSLILFKDFITNMQVHGIIYEIFIINVFALK